jgi:ferredoxin
MDPLVRFLPSQRSVRVPAGTSLLEAARRAGLPIASACSGDGACGRCGVRLLDGQAGSPPESEPEAIVKARNRVDADLRLACRMGVSADMTVTTAYW